MPRTIVGVLGDFGTCKLVAKTKELLGNVSHNAFVCKTVNYFVYTAVKQIIVYTNIKFCLQNCQLFCLYNCQTNNKNTKLLERGVFTRR